VHDITDLFKPDNLVIDSNAKSLKGPGGWVDSLPTSSTSCSLPAVAAAAVPQLSLPNGSHQLLSSFDGLLFPCCYNPVATTWECGQSGANQISST
jgi:hypothetical protein